MEGEANKNAYVGATGVPPPDDPMFNGRVIISAGNHVVSNSHFEGNQPTQNAPDNKEFRDKLKQLLVSEGYIREDEFDGIVERNSRKIKRVENFIYYDHGEMDVNVRYCAVFLGYYKRKEASGNKPIDTKK